MTFHIKSHFITIARKLTNLTKAARSAITHSSTQMIKVLYERMLTIHTEKHQIVPPASYLHICAGSNHFLES